MPSLNLIGEVLSSTTTGSLRDGNEVYASSLKRAISNNIERLEREVREKEVKEIEKRILNHILIAQSENGDLRHIQWALESEITGWGNEMKMVDGLFTDAIKDLHQKGVLLSLPIFNPLPSELSAEVDLAHLEGVRRIGKDNSRAIVSLKRRDTSGNIFYVTFDVNLDQEKINEEYQKLNNPQ